MVKSWGLILSVLLGGLLAQHRGIWVVRNSLKTHQDLQRLQQIHYKLNLTDVYLQVHALGHDVYPTKGQNDLSLQSIVRFLHDHNIKVHGWINVLYIWSKKQPPPEKNHVFNTDPDHLMTWADQPQPDLAALRKAGLEGFFVDPNSFANYTQIQRLIQRLIQNYNFDGIHFDYIRYPGRQAIFSAHLRTRFMKRYFVDPARFYGKNALNPVILNTYENFLLNELNKLVENLNDVVKQVNESCLVTMAVKPEPQRARSEYLQDWLYWLKNDNCDYVITMNYAPQETEFLNNLNVMNQLPFYNKIVCGIGAYYLDSVSLEKRLQWVNRTKLKGFSLFSFTTLKNKPELLTLVSSQKALNLQPY